MSESGTEVAGLLQRLWAKQKATGLSDFAGLNVSVRVPITQAVIDDLMRPVPLPDGVRDLRVLLAGNNLLRVEFTIIKFFLRQAVRIEARVDRAVGFPHEPYLDLTLLTGGLVELALNVFPLPDCIRITGKLFRVDLGLLLRRGGLEWLTAVLSPMTVNIQLGIARLDTILSVPEATP